MDFTTLARVKALHGAMPDNKHDAVLTAIIAGRSADAELLLDRHATVGNYTETLNVRRGQHVFRVKGYPVNSVASVVNDGVGLDLAGVTHDAEGYIRIGPAFGLGVNNPYSQPMAGSKLQGELIYGPGALTITYNGGMGANTNAIIAAFPALAYAMDQQVLFDFKRKDNLTQNSLGLAEGQTNFAKMDWLPSVLKTLLRFKRKAYIG